MDQLPGLPGGNPVGSPDRGPMERFTKILSITLFLLATAEALDGERPVHQSLGTSLTVTRQPARG